MFNLTSSKDEISPKYNPPLKNIVHICIVPFAKYKHRFLHKQSKSLLMCKD